MGYLQVLLSAAAFASSSLFAKWAYAAGFTPWSLSLSAALLSLPVLAPLVQRRAGAMEGAVEGAMEGAVAGAVAGGRPPRWAVLLHAASGGLSGLLFNLALARLDISLATLLLFSFPALVVLGARLFCRERLRPVQQVAVVLTLVGAALCVGPIRGVVEAAGVLLAAGTALSHAVYMLLGERVLARWDPYRATLATRVAIFLGALLLKPQAALELLAFEPLHWGLALLTGVVAGVLPFLLLLQGIARVGASQAAVVSAAELPIALLLGWGLMGHHLSGSQGLGALLVAMAVLLVQWPRPNPAAAAEAAAAAAESGQALGPLPRTENSA